MLTDFTNKLAGEAARLTDVARALGAAMAKRLDAWLRAGANPPPAGFTPVSLRPGWTCLTAMPPAPSAGASPLLNPAAAPLVRAYPDPPAKAGRGRAAPTAPFNTVEHTVTGGYESLLDGPAAAGGRCRAAWVSFLPSTSASRRLSTARFPNPSDRIGKNSLLWPATRHRGVEPSSCYIGGAKFLHINYTGDRLFRAFSKAHAHGLSAIHLVIRPIMSKRLTVPGAFVRRVNRYHCSLKK
jgi:hypothetical protein